MEQNYGMIDQSNHSLAQGILQMYIGIIIVWQKRARSQGIAMATPKAEKDLHLPLSRVKTIMKSSPDVEAVGQEPLYLVTKVTELFVIDLAKRAFKTCNGKSIEYKHIAEVVQEDDTLDFLREIMPRKITVSRFKEMMAKKAAKGDRSDESSEESSEEESSEESSSENAGD